MPDTRDPVGRKPASRASAPPASHRAGGRLTHREHDVKKDLRPIGPEKLRALGEAIRNGTYPLEENAELGLLRMLLDSPRHRPGPDEDA